MNVLVFVLLLMGGGLMISACCPGVYRPAVMAVRHRAPKQTTQTEIVVQRIAAVLEPHIDIEPIKRGQLADNLKSLDYQETPELWKARSLARASLIAAALFPFLLLSPFFGLAAMILTGVALYQQQQRKLTAEMGKRRQIIERELPQFASTIRQSLNNTHDVVAILETYHKVCSPVLRSEITRTLNDMVTGNQERAIKALESRVASPKLGQVTRGLIAVLRGDDQRLYFDMLAAEFRKSQNEEVEKELLKRPSKLYPYMGLLFVCMVLMIAASLGAYMVQQMFAYFH